MQYGHLKLQRSSSEIRKSCKGRPSASSIRVDSGNIGSSAFGGDVMPCILPDLEPLFFILMDVCCMLVRRTALPTRYLDALNVH
jgi:hypothetical protein